MSGRMFHFRSRLEHLVARKIDRKANVAAWDFESIRVPVPRRMQGAVGARYLLPDFHVRFDCGEEWIYEAKGMPYLEDYQRKEQVIMDYCFERDIFYQVVFQRPYERRFEHLEEYCDHNPRFVAMDLWQPMTVREHSERGYELI